MLNVIVLGALVRLNMELDNPWIATGIFAFVGFIFGLMFGHSLLAILVTAVLQTGLGYFYFWLLNKTNDNGFWWVVMISGITVFFFI